MKSRFDPLFQAHEEEFRAEMLDRERERMPRRVEAIEATLGRMETWLRGEHGMDDRADRIENLLREQIQQAVTHANAVKARLTIIILLLAGILFFVSR